MINFTKYNTILWDFDGVLMDSMPVRDRGFEMVLASYPRQEVEQLLTYHRQNGGLSRYVKFRYFFEKIRRESITEAAVGKLAEEFSQVMRRELLNKELLIEESVAFVKKNHQHYKMHVVSGSDQNELRYLCRELELDTYFISIHGSPTPKKQLVATLMQQFNYPASTAVFIGDSKNDWEAATAHAIDFVGFNNPELIALGVGYVHAYNDIQV
jgi:HAD superfamily hydrolase (TIGR01549 family)